MMGLAVKIKNIIGRPSPNFCGENSIVITKIIRGGGDN